MTVSGRVRNNWALVLLLAVGIGVLAYTHRSAFSGANWSARVGFLPELLFLTGGLFRGAGNAAVCGRQIPPHVGRPR